MKASNEAELSTMTEKIAHLTKYGEDLELNKANHEAHIQELKIQLEDKIDKLNQLQVQLIYSLFN